MRHWLAGSLSSVTAHSEGRMLAKERPALFRDLPESFKAGQPLPQKMVISPQPSPGCAALSRSRERGTSFRSDGREIARRGNHRPRFVHGCELLPA